MQKRRENTHEEKQMGKRADRNLPENERERETDDEVRTPEY